MENEKKYLRLLTIPFFLLIPALWIFGERYLNPFSLIFGTFGLFMFIVFVLNLISIYHSRNNKVVSGTCLSSDFNRILDNRGVILVEYWQNTFEYYDGVEKKTASFKSEKQFAVGSAKKLNIGKNITVLQKDVDEAKSRKNIFKMLYFVIGSIIGIIVSEFLGRSISSSDFDKSRLILLFPLIIGPVFALIGFANIRGAILDNRKIKEAAPINAKILGYREDISTDSDGDYHISYMPLYEYTYRGKTKTYQSNIGSGRRKRVGDIEEIYILNGKILEKRGAKVKMIIGIVFFALGLVVTGAMGAPAFLTNFKK